MTLLERASKADSSPAPGSSGPRPAELDLRDLPAPEPMMRALAAAEVMAPGSTLVVLTPLLPMPLLQLLAVRGFDASAECQPGGTASVTIRRPDDRAACSEEDGQARP